MSDITALLLERRGPGAAPLLRHHPLAVRKMINVDDFRLALYKGAFEAAMWMETVAFQPEWLTVAAVALATSRGEFDYARRFRARGYAWGRRPILDAILFDDRAALEWLHGSGAPRHAHAVRTAVECNNPHLTRWLLDNDYSFDLEELAAIIGGHGYLNMLRCFQQELTSVLSTVMKAALFNGQTPVLEYLWLNGVRPPVHEWLPGVQSIAALRWATRKGMALPTALLDNALANDDLALVQWLTDHGLRLYHDRVAEESRVGRWLRRQLRLRPLWWTW